MPAFLAPLPKALMHLDSGFRRKDDAGLDQRFFMRGAS
jgi:hypothetical protein